MDSPEIWPPPPDILPPAQKKVKAQWFRPALLFAVSANLLACLPAIGMYNEKQGEQMMDGYMAVESFIWWLPIAIVTICIGIPLTIWQIRLRRAAGQEIVAEVFGLLLFFVPYWSGSLLFQAMVKAKGFVIIG